MRKSRAGERKSKPVVWEVIKEHMPAIPDIGPPVMAPYPASAPQPWEIAATAFVPFMEANDTHQDAWLLFQAYHLSEQTRLLQAILAAVSID